MKIDNEEKLMAKLGIESWRNLSKEKFTSFVSSLPELDVELAKQVVGQFPNFKDLVLGTLDDAQEQAKKAIGAGVKGQNKLHKAFKQQRKILAKELDREDLSDEARFKILEFLNELMDKQVRAVGDNQDFMLKVLGITGAIALFVVGGAAALLGVRLKIGGGGGA